MKRPAERSAGLKWMLPWGRSTGIPLAMLRYLFPTGQSESS